MVVNNVSHKEMDSRLRKSDKYFSKDLEACNMLDAKVLS
jgi:hypothetical protein